MLRFAIIAGVAALSAVGAAQAVVSLDKARSAGLAAAAVVPGIETGSALSARPASIRKAKDGHYWAEAEVNDTHVRFLVDTGASAVALTAADATRLGIKPASLAYDYKVMTASGEARAAKVKLASVAVAGARLTDVDALVIDKGLDTSLLGMSYLGRLSRWEATPNALILRP